MNNTIGHIIGVDNGNAETKTEHCRFDSGLLRSDMENPLAEDRLIYQGQHYSLNTRQQYQHDKTVNEDMWILTLFAIAKELSARGVVMNPVFIDLAVGLPLEHYLYTADTFGNYFRERSKEPARFTYNGKQHMVHIASVHVFPQAYAAMAQCTLNLSKYPRTLIVDIGGYTVDVVSLSSGVVDKDLCKSYPLGIITLTGKLASRVQAQFGVGAGEKEIAGIIANREGSLLSDKVKLAVRQEAENHAESIIRHISENTADIVDMSGVATVFMGGGSLLLKRYLDKSPKLGLHEYIPSVHANAIGFAKLAEAALKKRREVMV